MALPGFNKSNTVEVVSAVSQSVESMLEAPEYSREALRLNDVSKLSAIQRQATIDYLCRRYGLPVDDGLITVIPAPGGVIRPYVTAAGVFRLARDRVKSLRVKVLSEGVPSGYVAVLATATTLDGRDFEAFGCKRAMADFHIALMQADTGARVRACRAAVGISLMTYAEAASLDESIEGNERNQNVDKQ